MAAPSSQRTRIAGPEPVDVPRERHATSWLWDRAGSGDGRHVVRFPVDESGERWDGLSVGQLADRVRSVAAGLVAAGVGSGDTVALMSRTRVDWTIADLAVLSAGAVTVPIYDTSSVEQCRWILEDSGAVIAIAGDAEQGDRLREAAGERVREILSMDDGALDELAGRAGAEDRSEASERCEALGSADLASIIYTSGTTGRPKGCRVTHGNLVWTVSQSRAALDDILKGEQSMLLFLPLAHVFARVVQFVGLESSVQLGYARSLEAMPDDLRTFRPTLLLAVPRVFQKVLVSAKRQATGVKRPIFDFAERTGESWCEASDPGRLLRARHRLADALVYRKIRAGVGGRVRYCLSGGAPLAPHLAKFFHAAGITILEGYGLTETTAPVAVNTPTALRFGTVGRPLPGVEVEIADDGEVLVRGGNVVDGYHNNPEADDDAFADGWLRTGDIGVLDDDGFLRITDRKKEVIVTAGGKNVAPSALEEQLKSSALISQAMLVGDDRAFIGALVTLDEDTVRDRLGEAPSDPNSDAALREEVQRAVDQANRQVSRAESIRKFVILDREFSESEDELTPTLKLRRAQIAEHFHEAIESLYASG